MTITVDYVGLARHHADRTCKRLRFTPSRRNVRLRSIQDGGFSRDSQRRLGEYLRLPNGDVRRGRRRCRVCYTLGPPHADRHCDGSSSKYRRLRRKTRRQDGCKPGTGRSCRGDCRRSLCRRRQRQGV